MLAIAEKTRCHLQETFLLQMIKNSLVERQWCHSWSIERKMVVSPWIATFRTFGCNLDININHTKLSKTGVWAKTQLYREETLFVSGKNAFKYLLNAPSPRLLCHEAHQQAFQLRAVVGDVIYVHPKHWNLNFLGRWDSAQNEQWMWMTKI